MACSCRCDRHAHTCCASRETLAVPLTCLVPSQDKELSDAVAEHGVNNWKVSPDTNTHVSPVEFLLLMCARAPPQLVASKVAGRSHTQCLQRWTKVLAPGLVRGSWSDLEDALLIRLVVGDLNTKDSTWLYISEQTEGRT